MKNDQSWINNIVTKTSTNNELLTASVVREIEKEMTNNLAERQLTKSELDTLAKNLLKSISSSKPNLEDNNEDKIN